MYLQLYDHRSFLWRKYQLAQAASLIAYYEENLLIITIIKFILTSVFHACMGWTVSYEAFFSARPLLTFFSFRLPLITSIHVLLGHHLGKLPLTLEILHLLDQILSSVLSRSTNNCSLLSCRHSLMLFNFSLFVSCLQ